MCVCVYVCCVLCVCVYIYILCVCVCARTVVSGDVVAVWVKLTLALHHDTFFCVRTLVFC